MSVCSFDSVDSFYDSEISIALPEEETVNPSKYKIKKCRGLLKYIQETMSDDKLKDLKKEKMLREIDKYKRKYGQDNFNEAYNQLFQDKRHIKNIRKKTEERNRSNSAKRGKGSLIGKPPFLITKKSYLETSDCLEGNLEDKRREKLITKKHQRQSDSKDKSDSPISHSLKSISNASNLIPHKQDKQDKQGNKITHNTITANNINKLNKNTAIKTASEFSSISGNNNPITTENLLSSGSSSVACSISSSFYNSKEEEEVREFSSGFSAGSKKKEEETGLIPDSSMINGVNGVPLWRENYLKFKNNFENNFRNLYGEGSKLSYHIYKAKDGFVYHFRSASMYVKNPNVIRLVCGKNHCAGSGVYDIIWHKLKTQHEHSVSKEEHANYDTLKKLKQDFEEEIKGLNPGEGFQIFIIKQNKVDKFLIIKDAA